MMLKAAAKTAALALVALCACSQPRFVERITIVNDTNYPANVDVTDGARDGWLLLTVVEDRSETTVQEVIDQGGEWIFRFDYARHAEELQVSRRELQANDWTVEVPQAFEQKLRAAGVPLPP